MMDFHFPTIDNKTLEHLKNLPVHWVKDSHALYDLIDEIDSIDKVALDTEFIKRSTYFPILALVQVNTGKAIYLVDVPNLDLTDFWQALIQVPQMIWYASGEDLGIFYLLARCPPLTNVFDVQIGMAYLTGLLQMGYARALELVLGVTLDKSESQSDWLMRPLSEKQTQYAADDVRYLLALSDIVTTHLVQKNLLAFVKEDSCSYADELYQIQHTPDNQLYLDYIAPFYSHEQITLLQALIAWRESLARSVNQPRSFIIGKQALREIIITMPTNIKILAQTTLSRNALRMYGKEIVRLVQEAKETPMSKRPPMPMPSLVGKDKPYQKALNNAIYKQAKKWQMPSELLFKNRWLALLLATAVYDEKQTMPKALMGYRQVWIKESILPIFYQYKTEILATIQQKDT